MKFLVVGAGKMGQAIAYDLASQKDTAKVILIDKDDARANSAALKIRSDLVYISTRISSSSILNLENKFATFDVVIGAADYSINLILTKLAIKHKTHFCDLGGNNTIVGRQFDLHDKAKKAGIAVMPDCGLAPGMAGWLAAYYIERYRERGGYPTDVKIRVGGLPQNPKPPLNYKLVFSAKGLINEYLEPCTVLTNVNGYGQKAKKSFITDVKPLTGLEEFIHSGLPNTILEAFHTSGGISTLADTFCGKVNNLDYKTIRYQGHCKIMQTLCSLGLFDGDIRLSIEDHFSRFLSNDDRDLVIVMIQLNGHAGKEVHSMLVYEGRHSAMAMTTGYSAAIVAHMMASGKIKDRGVLRGELAIPLNTFIEELTNRGLMIKSDRL